MNKSISKYLVVDGMLHGTGIRLQYEGGYIEPEELEISEELIHRLRNWLNEYENLHYSNYEDKGLIEKLDSEGLDITKALKEQLNNFEISYFSSANLTKYNL